MLTTVGFTGTTSCKGECDYAITKSKVRQEIVEADKNFFNCDEISRPISRMKDCVTVKATVGKNKTKTADVVQFRSLYV